MITVIANLKGGTGKSTVTFNLAVWLGSQNRRAAVIDLDPQRTLTDVAALRMEEGIEPAIRVEAGSFSDVTFPEDTEEIVIDVGTADLESFKQAIAADSSSIAASVNAQSQLVAAMSRAIADALRKIAS